MLVSDTNKFHHYYHCSGQENKDKTKKEEPKRIRTFLIIFTKRNHDSTETTTN